MTNGEVTRVAAAVRRVTGVSLVRIGAGRYQTIGLFGPRAEAVAGALEDAGLSRAPLSGTGSSRLDLIAIGR